MTVFICMLPTTVIVCDLYLGQYMFIESSYPRQTYDEAVLVSETIPTSGDGKCVRFWYHMSGSDIGSLSVYMRVGYDISESEVWRLKGDQSTGGNDPNKGWKQGQVPFLGRGQNVEVCQFQFFSSLTSQARWS